MEGMAVGIMLYYEEGINMCKAIQDLMGSSSHDRIQDMVKAAEDEQYRQKLFREPDEGQE